MSLFGSYANGTADANSDVDLLVEFFSSNVSLVMLFDIKDQIEAKLSKKVDIIHAPLDEDLMINLIKLLIFMTLRICRFLKGTRGSPCCLLNMIKEVNDKG